MVIRVKRNQYKALKENIQLDFDYVLNHTASKISEEIFEKYPLIEFQVWDFMLLNQFLNHFISHNCIFVEVESDLVATVFE